MPICMGGHGSRLTDFSQKIPFSSDNFVMFRPILIKLEMCVDINPNCIECIIALLECIIALICMREHVFFGALIINYFIISNQRDVRPGQLPPPSVVCQDTVDFIFQFFDYLTFKICHAFAFRSIRRIWT